jgi:hypothetical protein
MIAGGVAPLVRWGNIGLRVAPGRRTSSIVMYASHL